MWGLGGTLRNSFFWSSVNSMGAGASSAAMIDTMQMWAKTQPNASVAILVINDDLEDDAPGGGYPGSGSSTQA